MKELEGDFGNGFGRTCGDSLLLCEELSACKQEGDNDGKGETKASSHLVQPPKCLPASPGTEFVRQRFHSRMVRFLSVSFPKVIQIETCDQYREACNWPYGQTGCEGTRVTLVDAGRVTASCSDFWANQFRVLLDAEPGVEYVVAMAKNAVLKRKAKPAMRHARQLSRRSGKTEHVYCEANYAARTWPRERRIVIKAEVVRADGKEPKDNPRFVITNLKQSPQWIYEKVYCQRGEIENRIKELHELQIDRTSCSDFWANQFRVLLTAAAYVLMQELRLRAAGTDCARAQVWTLRERLLKLGARVLVSVRRVMVHLPASFPFLPTFRRVALALGASPG